MQLNYSQDMQVALVGMLADLGNKNTMSYAAEVEMEPADIVVLGTDKEKQCKLPTSKEELKNILGIVMHVHKEASCCGKAAYYPQSYTVPVLTKGRIYVAVEGDVVAGEAATYDLTKKVFKADGDAVTGVVFRSAAHDGMAVVEIL